MSRPKREAEAVSAADGIRGGRAGDFARGGGPASYDGSLVNGALSASRAVARAEAVLRERIETGFYPPRQWLPAERTLAADLGVHRGAVRIAIDRLAGEGLIQRNARCRPVVSGGAREMSSDMKRRPAARTLASRFVALIMGHRGFEQGASVEQRIFWGMNEVLTREGCHGTFLDLGEEDASDEENARREAELLRYAIDGGFGGVAILPRAYRSNRAVLQEAARVRPLVLVDHMIAGVETDHAGVDNLGSMRTLARHLIGLGHTRIAYITSTTPINTVQDRLEGYRAAMRNAGLTPLVLFAGNEHDCEHLDFHWRRPGGERPTAILCVNDWLATIVYRRLTAMGLSVPGDISLAGFDNVVHTLPNGVGLTTVAQPYEEIGRSAARLLLARMASSGSLPRHVELPATLISRASVIAP